LLTTPNPEADSDRRLFEKLGIHGMSLDAVAGKKNAAEL
jgi:hypothetical protein